MYKLGIDLGGTKIEGIVLSESGEVLFRDRIQTEQEKGYEAILANMRNVYDLLLGEIGNADHTLGICTPGALSKKSGFLKNSNTVCLNQRLTANELRRALEHPFVIQNDANCFAMAEAHLGAGRGRRMVFGVILGTGCGGGIVYDGNVLEGAQAIAGEWGHMVIDPGGPECYCGARGCVETFISGGGAQKRYASLTGQKLAFKELVFCKDPLSVQFMEEYYRLFGQSMANLIHILDPDIVVLGGGVSNLEPLYTRGVEAVKERIFSDSLETPIVKNELGDSAGVFGAALVGI